MRPPPITERPSHARAVHRGPVFTVWQWSQTMYDGSTRTYEQLSRRDTVLVLPITLGGRVILARESQPGVRSRLHAIGGRVEDGESPDGTARREMFEEIGLTSRTLELWASWQPLSKIDWAVYLYWAGGLESQGSSEPNDVGERLELVERPAEDLLEFRGLDDLEDAEVMYQIGLAAVLPRAQEAMMRSYKAAVQ